MLGIVRNRLTIFGITRLMFGQKEFSSIHRNISTYRLCAPGFITDTNESLQTFLSAIVQFKFRS